MNNFIYSLAIIIYLIYNFTYILLNHHKNIMEENLIKFKNLYNLQ